jgi:Protein of unknown function (DUF2510)
MLGPGLICIGVYNLTGQWGGLPATSNDDLIAGTVFLMLGSGVTILFVTSIVRSVRRRKQAPPNLPPPGWYPDPSGAPGIQRYWDGTRWGVSRSGACG